MKRNGKVCQGCMFQGIEAFTTPVGIVYECFALNAKPKMRVVKIFSDEYVMCPPDGTCEKWQPEWKCNWIKKERNNNDKNK